MLEGESGRPLGLGFSISQTVYTSPMIYRVEDGMGNNTMMIVRV